MLAEEIKSDAIEDAYTPKQRIAIEKAIADKSGLIVAEETARILYETSRYSGLDTKRALASVSLFEEALRRLSLASREALRSEGAAKRKAVERFYDEVFMLDAALGLAFLQEGVEFETDL
jgi:hypothetical protein